MRWRSALLALCVVAVPFVFFSLGRFGSSSSPESRHLIFALPFFAIATACGVWALARRPPVAALALAGIVVAQVSWAWHKTPALFDRESTVRVAARASAAAWIASSARPDDVLFGYEPVYLAAWERSRQSVSRFVVPRADPKLALAKLRNADRRLGRGIWVFDAGDTTNVMPRQQVDLRLPFPHAEFEGVAYGPFLVIRTTRPTQTIERYLDNARKVELIGKSLDMGDADVNYATIMRAALRYELSARPSPARASP